MPVEFSETLTQDRLKSKSLLIDNECQKVIECFKARGYRRPT